jgi:hypothetical protein
MSNASAVMCYEAINCPRCSSASIVKNGDRKKAGEIVEAL